MGYTYSDTDFSIDKLPITYEELESLSYATQLLHQYKNTAPFNQLQGAINKIFKHVEVRNELSSDEFKRFVDIESSVETKGLEHITKLVRAIREKMVVKITHKSFSSSKESEYTLHPYLLKEYRNRFYIFGYCNEFKALRKYGLDRIECVKRVYGIKYRISKKPPVNYFKNVIGVTKFKGTKPERIKLRFSKHQTPYIKTQPLHSSQKIVKETDNYTIVTLDVHNSPELQIILLGWNENVEVLEPECLRNRIKEMIEGAAKLYNIV